MEASFSTKIKETLSGMETMCEVAKIRYEHPRSVKFYVGEPWNNSQLVKKLLRVAEISARSKYSHRTMKLFYMKLTNDMLQHQQAFKDAQTQYEQHVIPFIAHAVSSVFTVGVNPKTGEHGLTMRP